MNLQASPDRVQEVVKTPHFAPQAMQMPKILQPTARRAVPAPRTPPTLEEMIGAGYSGTEALRQIIARNLAGGGCSTGSTGAANTGTSGTEDGHAFGMPQLPGARMLGSQMTSHRESFNSNK